MNGFRTEKSVIDATIVPPDRRPAYVIVTARIRRTAIRATIAQASTSMTCRRRRRRVADLNRRNVVLIGSGKDVAIRLDDVDHMRRFVGAQRIKIVSADGMRRQFRRPFVEQRLDSTRETINQVAQIKYSTAIGLGRDVICRDN